jgi:uncharacterized protein (TIGR03435 family)
MSRFVLAAVAVATALAQTPITEFEAAAIKAQRPSSPMDPMQPETVVAAMPLMKGGPGSSTPGRIRYSNVTLTGLITKAWDLSPNQITGPAWIKQDAYSIDAVVPPGATKAQFLLMIQNLLLSRFKLAYDWTEKDFKVYKLTVAPGGLMLKTSGVPETGAGDDPDLDLVTGFAAAELDSRGCPILPPTRRASKSQKICTTWVGWTVPEFSRFLGMMVAREIAEPGANVHIVDETGLMGRFDFFLNYDVGYHAMINSPVIPDKMRENIRTSNPISIFKAVEKDMGFKLEPATMKLKVMAIRRAERTPTEE